MSRQTTKLTLSALAVVITLSTAQLSQAQSIQDFMKTARRVHNGVVAGGSQVSQQVNKQFTKQTSGSSHYYPQPPRNPGSDCHTGYCPPPPPKHCYVYIVYYYDCHYGWKYYGEYHNRYAADAAVDHLQRSGYRAYMKTEHRSGDIGYNPGFGPGNPPSFPAVQ